MERKNIIIICSTIIIVMLIACGTIIYMSSAKDTTLYLKDNTIDVDDKLVFVLVDEDKNPLNNKTIQITVYADNNKSKSFNLTTNEKGVAKLSMKYEGKFKVNATFAGEFFLSSSNLTKKVVVKEKEVETSNYDNFGPAVDYRGITREYAMAHNYRYVIAGEDIGIYVPYDPVAKCWHS